MEYYDCALELCADHKEAHIAKGAALANLKKFKSAVASFEKALELSPTNKNANKYLEVTRARIKTTPAAKRPPSPPPKEDITRSTGMVLDWADEQARMELA